ncbi:helix-turn-helix transcriptional regulator [Streptomyces sp. NPDC048045]|uniref:helix-turn-helix transcriptional regulator n=1 Tax=Streptomyces sp. NPDC048045 TaxID=3154710 RepID=UPI00342B7C5B
MSHCRHGIEELCDAGAKRYEQALRDGHLRAEDAVDAPCLTELGLLHPSLDDLGRLEPVAPAALLNHLLRGSRARIAEERRREDRLTALFEPLLHDAAEHGAHADTPTLRILTGTDRINGAISDATAEATHELLCVQPNVHYHNERGRAAQAVAMDRDQAVLDRGARIRTLYQHTQRNAPLVLARYEQLRGDAQARALDELPDRLILIDRTVAFVPAGEDGRLALEVRHPALLRFFATAFDRLWRLATPMYPQAVQRPTLNGVTPRQRAIAALLTEGHTDTAIADRLGMNVRTARVHIAKLATTLGSESRAQLGYLIARSGILDPES